MFQALLNALGSRNTTTEDAAYDDSLEEQPDDDIVRVTTRNVRRRDQAREEEARRPTQWVAWRISHAHKHRCREWVAARFPDCTLEQNAKDALLFSASDAAAVVAALAKDEHAARHVHACAAHGGSTARLEDVPGLAEAAYDAAAATAARLRVRGAPGLKEALLKNLPERIQLTPRGASHELVVDAVPATHATYYYVGCAPLAETFVPSTGDAGDVCRAVHKLREAMVRFALPPFRRVVDVGAAPGGWSQVCLEHGAELVVAVDPADLDADVAARVQHVKKRLEDAATLDALREAGGRFDAVLCDANAHPAKMGRALHALRPYLAAGATLVLTLKQPSASTKTAAADTGEVEGALAAGGFRDLRTAWLWANGRKERTLAATYT